MTLRDYIDDFSIAQEYVYLQAVQQYASASPRLKRLYRAIYEEFDSKILLLYSDLVVSDAGVHRWMNVELDWESLFNAMVNAKPKNLFQRFMKFTGLGLRLLCFSLGIEPPPGINSTHKIEQLGIAVLCGIVVAVEQARLPEFVMSEDGYLFRLQSDGSYTDGDMVFWSIDEIPGWTEKQA